MTIQNPLVHDLVDPLLGLDAAEIRWRAERWLDYLQTRPVAEVENYQTQLLSEISRIEGQQGPPDPAPPEYPILMELYTTVSFVLDMHRLGMK